MFRANCIGCGHFFWPGRADDYYCSSCDYARRREKLWPVAIHEAGHAAFALHFSFEIVSAVLTADGRYSNVDAPIPDTSSIAQGSDDNAAQQMLRFNRNVALYYLGGTAAQRQFYSEEKFQILDVRKARLYLFNDIRSRAARAELRETFTEACQLADDLWPEITRIANALYDHRKMTGEEIKALFAQSATNAR